MSKPVFEDVFKFEGRRNRLSYNLLCLAVIAGFIGVAVVGMVGVQLLDAFAPLGWLFLLTTIAAFVALVVASWAVASQRVRDAGHSGIWVLACLIPYIGWIVSIGLMIIPSTPGENKYGPSCIEQ